MTVSQFPNILGVFAIYAVYGTTFGLAGGMKVIEKNVPQWFVDQFSKTFLSFFPTLSVAYWSIALLECLVPLFLIISIVKLEFIPGQNPVFLGIAVGLAGVIFCILGFGLRLVNDFPGAANSFFYFAATLVTQIYLQKIVR